MENGIKNTRSPSFLMSDMDSVEDAQGGYEELAGHSQISRVLREAFLRASSAVLGVLLRRAFMK